MTMHDIEDYFKNRFDLDILHGKDACRYNNTTIHTLTLPENDPEYYNKNKEQVFCKILISKKWYEPEYFSEVIKAQKLDPDYYDSKIWKECGWDGEEIQF